METHYQQATSYRARYRTYHGYGIHNIMSGIYSNKGTIYFYIFSQNLEATSPQLHRASQHPSLCPSVLLAFLVIPN